VEYVDARTAEQAIAKAHVAREAFAQFLNQRA
jgi:hypothetical protein